MPMNILMPSSMADGTLARWLKQVGERVRAGDVVAEVETDKALMQIESPYDGVLKEIRVAEGRPVFRRIPCSRYSWSKP